MYHTHYLLDNNILHRDLKPQNILLTNNYDLKITDFGFARYVDKSKDIVIQTLCGTPMYMAPEIMKYKKYDIKSDLWSVGVIMYQMLFGKLPYNAKNFLDLIKSIDKKPIKIPDFITVSPSCKDLLLKLLQKDPNKRINWNDFFNHHWFNTDETLNLENKLLHIDMNNTLPSLSEFNIDKNQFCSFKHRSIKDMEKELDETESTFMPQFDSENDSGSSNSSRNKNLHKDSNFDNTDSESEIYSSTDSFKSINDTNQNINLNINKNIKIRTAKSEPINIIKPEKNLFVSNNTYQMINTIDYNGMSDPTHNKSLTESLKGYLYSSMQFLQQSYNYLSNNSKSL